ncbi:uncharacterized protein BDR25DRAFT_343655 [Lindgomyces ingoldianus]|uniref:Uncharacterized protein n=1 Tax=Lindgomyces ingoldianus TaxID=673940 RepID=A0ACB6QUC9_9PLEO|nr:uncharacterized protein BDR25DRAFT_343655 [Lindgomyces ingoldianus]KAF2469687.1 hypothetical protein BDR25DRAFT_343655 [Lindgomyces ingoldianus]
MKALIVILALSSYVAATVMNSLEAPSTAPALLPRQSAQFGTLGWYSLSQTASSTILSSHTAVTINSVTRRAHYLAHNGRGVPQGTCLVLQQILIGTDIYQINPTDSRTAEQLVLPSTTTSTRLTASLTPTATSNPTSITQTERSTQTVPAPPPSSTSPPSSPGQSTKNTGIIVGGVIGGIVAVGAIGIIALLILRRGRGQPIVGVTYPPSQEYGMPPVPDKTSVALAPGCNPHASINHSTTSVTASPAPLGYL